MGDLNDEPDAPGSASRKTQESRSSHSTDESPHANTNANQTSSDTPQKKKRKVNHACIYCRRSHMTCDSDRPCQRCIKRNIGHLCHDEPHAVGYRKKTDSIATTSEQPTATAVSGPAMPEDPRHSIVSASIDLSAAPSNVVPVSATASQQPDSNGSTVANRFNFNEQWLGSGGRLQDISTFHPSYMFNANEVTDEYNLLNDFLSTSLFDESGMFSTEDVTAYSDPSLVNSMNASVVGNNLEFLPVSQPGASVQALPASSSQEATPSRIVTTKPMSDRARDKYYMTAADPSGTDPPEERMYKLLRAKYDAGMLKPFNYVSGYARLNKFMEKNMKASSRHKILMQLDKFRPKFRERMQSLTDIELVMVEMWFETSLMEYDRVFASMAIPACCWRRTGEVFRGNKEMAQLINVPIESLRDGKLAIHDFIVEDQLVSYWEKFCAICFDQQQKAMLTSCTLRSLGHDSNTTSIHCGFSFTIRRDNHNIPSLIVGNFLPMDNGRPS